MNRTTHDNENEPQINKIFSKFQYKGYYIFKESGGLIYYNYNNDPKKLWTFTNLFCAHDSHPIDNTPIPIPIYHDKISDKYQLLFPYLFCSPNCALSYIGDHQIHSTELTKIIFMNMMIKIFGIHKKIHPAKPRYCLNIFSNSGMDIQEFRKDHIITNNKVKSNELIQMTLNHTNTKFSNIPASDHKGFFESYINKCIKNNLLKTNEKNTTQKLSSFLK
jgi:hypothetical protein